MKTNNISISFRIFTTLAITSLFALVLTTAGCGGGGGGSNAGGLTPPATATTLNAVLNGTQEIPPVTTAATGTATVTVDAAKTTITVTLNTTGLTGVTASHIHFGATGVSGGVMFSLFAAPATFTSPLTKTLTSTDFKPIAGVATFADAVTAILAGNAYINVHTTANVGGEIRGQIGVTPPATATTLNAALNGTQEIPPVTTAATGTATVAVDAAKTTITVTLNATGLTGVTASHIHFGAAGANGGVMFSLLAAPATFTSPLTKTLTSADFTPVAGVTTFADAVTAILAGNAYINVHTTANVGGEIRGQLTP